MRGAQQDGALGDHHIAFVDGHAFELIQAGAVGLDLDGFVAVALLGQRALPAAQTKRRVTRLVSHRSVTGGNMGYLYLGQQLHLLGGIVICKAGGAHHAGAALQHGGRGRLRRAFFGIDGQPAGDQLGGGQAGA